jgi:hypothetical protein
MAMKRDSFTAMSRKTVASRRKPRRNPPKEASPRVDLEDPSMPLRKKREKSRK